MKRAFLSFLILLSLIGCGDQKIDTTKARQEMESREIKVVSDARILEEAKKIGDFVSSGFSVSLASNDSLTLNVDFGGDTVFQKHHYFFDGPNNLEGKTLEIFEAYKYNKENGLEPFSNVQKLDQGETLLYTNAMMLNDTIFMGIWAIHIPRKHVVLNIKD